MSKDVAAALHAIEGLNVMIIDRVLVLQPVKAGVDWAPISCQDVGCVLGIDLVGGFIESGPEKSRMRPTMESLRTSNSAM